MAENQHWVSELFPVKFTVNDVLRVSTEGETSLEREGKSEGAYKEIYERVIAEEVARKAATATIGANHENEGVSVRDNVRSGEQVDKVRQEVLSTEDLLGIDICQSRSSTKNDCIWSKEDLNVFRAGYFNLKKKATHLLVLLSLAKSEIKGLKKKCRIKDKAIAENKLIISEQSREMRKLNATVFELTKDVDFHNKQWKRFCAVEAELKNQVLSLKKELDKERTELEKSRNVYKSLGKKIESEKKLAEEMMIEQKTKLEMNYLHDVRNLEIKNINLKEKLERETYEHQTSKKALEQLRRHFANMHSVKTSSNFLDVVDIQPIPDN
eukprot:gene11160-12332_t